ncbi:MAG: DUF748 domain-containing protein [Candidatus Omnitrophica bacterium]|nr:DUF748 domain-containing protein [Candidatus Omnitrophota bacterium]
MLKKILVVFVVVFAFLVASVYLFRSNIKKYALDTILKSFPLPNVALASVTYDETSGKLNLEEIKVKSPKGFLSEYIMEADSIDMDISFSTKPKLNLNINEIDIANPAFYVERARNGQWNFQEFQKKNLQAALDEKSGSGFIKEAFAAGGDPKPQVILPRVININDGTVHLLDSYVKKGETHRVDLAPINGVVTLQYDPSIGDYNKISFNGSCNVAESPYSKIKGDLEVYPAGEQSSYACQFNAYNISLAALKPYLDRYTPFIVTRGSFNMASDVKCVNGSINGDYTMELMDLALAVNPEKSNIPFLETSVKKITLYLTNQKGNVVLDFKQKGSLGGKTTWALGPIAKRAVGMMAIDTVIDFIEAIDKGTRTQETLPGDIPPEVIDIFRGIFN